MEVGDIEPALYLLLFALSLLVLVDSPRSIVPGGLSLDASALFCIVSFHHFLNSRKVIVAYLLVHGF